MISSIRKNASKISLTEIFAALKIPFVPGFMVQRGFFNDTFQIWKQPPPINSLKIEFMGTLSLGIPTK